MLHISSHIIISYHFKLFQSHRYCQCPISGEPTLDQLWQCLEQQWHLHNTKRCKYDVWQIMITSNNRWWEKTKAWWATPAQPKNISNGRFSRCTRATALLSESASSLSSSSFYDIYPPPQPWSNQAQPCSLHFNSLRSRLLRPLEGRQVHRKGYFFIIWFLSLFFIFSLKGGLGDSNSPLCCSILPSNQVEST